jgi:exonuclease III
LNSYLKILTWNCNGAFRKKYKSVQQFNSDILVIQECEDPGITADTEFKRWASNFLWTGDNKNRGLGIFAKHDIQIKKLTWKTTGEKHFIPCRINDDFNLLATWCHGANLPAFAYIGQLWKYLQLNKSRLKKSVIAGDFNSNVIWDKKSRWWNHSDCVRELTELGIESMYHHHFQEAAGLESQPTFYLQRNISKSYHIDYIFASKDFHNKIINFEIGIAGKWLVNSDHMPVVLTIQQ